MEQTKFMLSEKEMPTHWYNVLPDLPEPVLPERHPVTKEPCPMDMPLPLPLFPDAVNKQEFSRERWIEIPEEVQAVYRTWRPTMLRRAYRLERALDTPARILYEYEGTSQAGSHKPNIAVAHPSLLYQERRLQACHHRNWCRAVGQRTLHGLRFLWPRA